MVSTTPDAVASHGLNGAGDKPPNEQIETEPGATEVRLRRLELLSITGEVGTPEDSLWGLALSGGGIRSATFALGVLQSLAQRGWLPAFHYLSTVSGGGYVGAYLQAMIHKNNVDEAMVKLAPVSDSKDSEQKFRKQTGATAEAVLALRKHSNFLSPRNGTFSADRLSMVTGFATNFLFIQLMLIPLLITLSFGISVVYRGLLEIWKTGAPSLLGPAALLCLLLMYHFARRDTSPVDGQSQPVEKRQKQALRRIRHERRSSFLAVSAAIFTLVMTSLTLWPAESIAPRTFSDLSSLAPTLTLVAIAFVYWLHRNDVEGQTLPRLFGTIMSLGAGLTILVLCLHLIQQIQMWESTAFLLMPLSAGTPLLFVAFFIAGSIGIGVSSLTTPPLKEPDKSSSVNGSYILSYEWAQFSGMCGLGVICFAVLPFVLVSMPAAMDIGLAAMDSDRAPYSYKRWTAASVAALVATPILGAVLLRSINEKATSFRGRMLLRTRDISNAIAPWALILAIALLVTWGSQEIVQSIVGTPESCSSSLVLESLRCQSEILKAIPRNKRFMLVGTFTLIAWIWYVSARRLNENDFSMNAFYRNRLVSCYLAPANKDRKPVRIDPTDDFPLGSLLRQKPERPLYPLICCAVNLTSGKHLDWQDRKAASFIFSPLFCGHVSPRNQSVDTIDGRNLAGDAYDIGDIVQGTVTSWSELAPSELAKQTTLGTAISVSGAVVSPSMGHYSSRAIGFLLTLFNARLGWWVENARADKARDFGLNIISEMLGDAGGANKYAHISDGGHFENLGIYELVRRRCRFIMCVDASADPSRDFEGLGNAIHKCRVDFGAEIDIDINAIKPNVSTGYSGQRAALGKISYDNGATGYLLYLKPCLLGDEPPDISNYASSESSFPHEPTSDQFFDERQFEAYRHLGFVSGQQLLSDALIGRISQKFAGTPTDQFSALHSVTLGNSEAKEALLLQLRHRFYEPSDAISLHFSRHGDALEKLYRTLRKDISLRAMDPYLFPGWPDRPLSSAAAGPGGPLNSDFRACFYFAQEQIQLMEAVYIDLELEHNHRHPDNRGWINMFRQWGWSPVFRIAWSLSAQTRGARFVRFCESRLRIPSIVDAVDISWEFGTGHASLLQVAEDHLGDNRLNAVEFSLLASNVVKASLESNAEWKLGILHVNWDDLVSNRENSLPAQLCVGIALVTKQALSDCICVLRVQDHLRCLGLGRAFASKLIEKINGPAILIAAGKYGLIGELSAKSASKQTDRIRLMVRDAQIAKGRP